jgi:hypothetical protein
LSDAQRREYFLEDHQAGPAMAAYAAVRPAIAWLLPAAGGQCE